MPEDIEIVNSGSRRVAPLEMRRARPTGSTDIADLISGSIQRRGPEYMRWSFGDPKKARPLQGKWLYVFVAWVTSSAAEKLAELNPVEDPLRGLGESASSQGGLVCEVWVDRDGRLFPVDATNHGKPARERRVPDPQVDAPSDALTLDYWIGDRLGLHFFFASPFRLSHTAIQRIGKELPRGLPGVALYLGRPDDLPVVRDDVLGVPVIDPLALGASLAEDFHDARDALMREGLLISTRGVDASSADRARVVEYLLARGLADVISAIAGESPSKAADLRGRMTETGRAAWQDAIHVFEGNVARLTTRAERSAATVCAWLESPLWRIYDRSVVEHDAAQDAAGVPLADRDVAFLLGAWSETVDRLNESTPGAEYLARVVREIEAARERGEPSLLDKYLLDPVESWGDSWKADRYSAKGFLKAYTQLITIYLRVSPALRSSMSALAKKIVDAANRAHGEKAFKVGKPISRRAFLTGRLSDGKVGKVTEIVVHPVEVDPDKIKRHLAKAQIKLGDFLAVLDVLNTFIAVCAATQATHGSVRPTLDAAAAATGAVKSILEQVWRRQGKDVNALRSIRILGGVAAAYYTVVDLIDAHSLYERGDYDAMAAKGVAAIAQTVVLVAAILSMGMLGTIAGIVAAFAYVAAVFLTEDDLQLLVAHSRWGEDHGETGRVRWAAGSHELSTWKSASKVAGLELQLRSFHGLNSAFDLAYGGHCYTNVNGDYLVVDLKTLTITHGQLADGSRFTVTWSWKTRTGSEQVEVSFTAEEVAIGFEHAAYGRSQRYKEGVHGVVWSAKERTFELSAPQKALDHLPSGTYSLHAEVRLDVLGDGEILVPDDEPVRLLFTEQRGTRLYDEHASSKTFD